MNAFRVLTGTGPCPGSDKGWVVKARAENLLNTRSSWPGRWHLLGSLWGIWVSGNRIHLAAKTLIDDVGSECIYSCNLSDQMISVKLFWDLVLLSFSFWTERNPPAPHMEALSRSSPFPFTASVSPQFPLWAAGLGNNSYSQFWHCLGPFWFLKKCSNCKYLRGF